MQTTAIRTIAKSLPENEVIFLTRLISSRYIPYTKLINILVPRNFVEIWETAFRALAHIATK